MNSVVGSIFNEKVAEKWNLWVYKQCIDALFTKDLVKCCGWIKKKKGKTRKNKHIAAFITIQTGNIYMSCVNEFKYVLFNILMCA